MILIGEHGPTVNLLETVEREGFAFVPSRLSDEAVTTLREAFDAAIAPGSGAVSRRGESAFGVRNILRDVPAVRAFATSPEIRSLIAGLIGPLCSPVRGIFFDKTPGANWKVVWHQDLSLALWERREIPGWGPWSQKAGVWHVQPPASFLEKMITLRVHLDPCGPENGPLRVLPGTHRFGRLDAVQITLLREQIAEVPCIFPRGGILLMRPLLLHASSAAQLPAHRRVLHIEWAAEKLPEGLEWNETTA